MLILLISGCEYVANNPTSPSDKDGSVQLELVITPEKTVLSVGESQTLLVQLLDPNGKDLLAENDKVHWDSSEQNIAVIDDQGKLTANSQGKVVISASVEKNSSKYTQSINIDVDAASMNYLYIKNLDDADFPVGITHEFQVYAAYSDSSTTEITQDPNLQCSLDNKQIASFTQEQHRSFITGISSGKATLSCMLKNSQLKTSATFNITKAVIQKIDISSGTETLPVGLTHQFEAWATFSDNSVLEVTNDPNLSWSLSDTKVASVNNSDNKGIVQGLTSGSVTITASWVDLELTTSTNLTITPPIITQLEMSLQDSVIPAGLNTAATVAATLSDKSVIDLTNDPRLTWSNSNPHVVTAEQTGAAYILTGILSGKSTISAKLKGSNLQAATDLTVSEPIISGVYITSERSNIPAGLTGQLHAWARLSDNSVVEVTDHPEFVWSSSDTQIASVSQSDHKGIITGLKPGNVTVSGTMSNVFKATTSLTIDEPIVTEIFLSASPESLPAGLTHAYQAWATLSDNSELEVTNDPNFVWSVNDTSIASIESGIVTASKPGKVMISGTLENEFQAEVELTIDHAIVVELSILMDEVPLPVGLTRQIGVNAKLSDGTTEDVTKSPDLIFSVSNPSLAEVTTDSNGNRIVAAHQIGSVIIEASGIFDDSQFSTVKNLVVAEAVITQLSISSASDEVVIGEPLQLQVNAVFSDESERDVSSSSEVNWSTTEQGIATVESSELGAFILGSSEGKVTITAKVDSYQEMVETAEEFIVTQNYSLEVSEDAQTPLSRTVQDGYDIDDIKVRQNSSDNFDLINSTPRYVNQPLVRLNDTYFKINVLMQPFQTLNFNTPEWFDENIETAQFVEEQPLFKTNILAYANVKPDDDRFVVPSDNNVYQYEKELRGYKLLMNNYDFNSRFISFIEEYMDSKKIVQSQAEHWCQYEETAQKKIVQLDTSSSDEFAKFKAKDTSSNTLKHISLVANKPNASYMMLVKSSDGVGTVGDGYLATREYTLFHEGQTIPNTTYLHEKMHNHGFSHSGGMTYGYPDKIPDLVSEYWGAFYTDGELETTTPTLAANYSLEDLGNQFKLEISLLDKSASSSDPKGIDKFILMTSSLSELKQSFFIDSDANNTEIFPEKTTDDNGTYIFNHLDKLTAQSIGSVNLAQTAPKLAFIFDKPEATRPNGIPVTLIFMAGSEEDSQQQTNLVIRYRGGSGFISDEGQYIYTHKSHIKNEEDVFVSDYKTFTPAEAEAICNEKGLTLGRLKPFKTMEMIEFQNKYLIYTSQVGLDSETGEPIAVRVPSGYRTSLIHKTDKGAVIVCSK